MPCTVHSSSPAFSWEQSVRQQVRFPECNADLELIGRAFVVCRAGNSDLGVVFYVLLGCALLCMLLWLTFMTVRSCLTTSKFVSVCFWQIFHFLVLLSLSAIANAEEPHTEAECANEEALVEPAVANNC